MVMTSFVRFAAAAFVFLFSGLASAATTSAPDAPLAQAPRVGASGDYLFPRAGSFTATGASGIPFLAIGEVTYGVGDGFAVGAVAAATPNIGRIHGTMGFGLRPRGVLFASGEWRSYVTVPIFYYPEVEGFGDMEPWMLVRPTVSLERRLPGGARVNAGFGAIAAACTESLVTLGREPTMEGGVWETATIGGTVPLSARTQFFGEGSLIMRGVTPARDWIGGAPVVAIAGITTAL
jgi:hypothetical protein